MAIPTIEFNYQRTEPNKKLEDYFSDRISKYSRLLTDALDIKCTLREHENRNYSTVIIMVSVPNAVVRVEEREHDFRAAIDTALETLGIRLKRYREKQRSWKGEQAWEHTEVGEDDRPERPAVVDYAPKIKRKNEYRSVKKISPAEAIETMELSGAPCFLFREEKKGTWTVVFQQEDGVYGLIDAS